MVRNNTSFALRRVTVLLLNDTHISLSVCRVCCLRLEKHDAALQNMSRKRMEYTLTCIVKVAVMNIQYYVYLS